MDTQELRSRGYGGWVSMAGVATPELIFLDQQGFAVCNGNLKSYLEVSPMSKHLSPNLSHWTRRAPDLPSCDHIQIHKYEKLSKEVPFQFSQNPLGPPSYLNLMREEQRISFKSSTWFKVICCLVEDQRKLEKNKSTGSWDFPIET